MDNDTGDRVVCPVCGEDHAHPVEIGVFYGCDEGTLRHTFTREGMQRRALPLSPRVCGVVFYSEYLGECGHRWREMREFCAGVTFIETTILPPEIGPLDVIWRA